MGLYIYRIVIDTNVINTQCKIPEMNELENYFKLGIVEIVYTDVLPVELAAWTRRKEKAFENRPRTKYIKVL